MKTGLCHEDTALAAMSYLYLYGIRKYSLFNGIYIFHRIAGVQIDFVGQLAQLELLLGDPQLFQLLLQLLLVWLPLLCSDQGGDDS